VTITEEGKPVNSMVFQEQSLFPWYTVKENIAYGLAMRGIPRPEREQITDHYLKITGLSKIRPCLSPSTVRRHEQRASVARAFANDPAILLLDEPFGSLDEQTRVCCSRNCSKSGRGLKDAMFITHSIDERWD